MERERFYYVIFETQWGWLGLLASTKGLQRVVLPQASPDEVLGTLSDSLHLAHRDEKAFGNLPHQFRQYFEGKRIEFSVQLDLAEATPFQRQVWEKVRSIPYGETRSYAWVAREIGQPRAFRAVGQALRGNPLPLVIPCHRVLGRDGQLVGFGGREGVELKKKLLQLEGCRLPSSLSALSWRNR